MPDTLYKVEIRLKATQGQETFLNMLQKLSGTLAGTTPYTSNNESILEAKKYKSLKEYIGSRFAVKNETHNVGGIHIKMCKVSEGSLDLFVQAFIIGISNFEKVRKFVDEVANWIQRDLQQILAPAAVAKPRIKLTQEAVTSRTLPVLEKTPGVDKKMQTSPAPQSVRSKEQISETNNSNGATLQVENQKGSFSLLHLGILIIIVLQAYTTLTNKSSDQKPTTDESIEEKDLVLKEKIRNEIQNFRIYNFLNRYDSSSALR